jgi:Tfp pilus assembly protein PilF
MIKADINTVKIENEAIRLLERGQTPRAKRLLKRLLAIDPKNITAHYQLVLAYFKTKEFKRAVYHSHCLLRLNPQETNVCLNLGLVYEFMGRDRLAIHYYKRELSRNPDNGPALSNIGLLYFEKHRWLQASKYLRRGFDLGDLFKRKNIFRKLGECYRALRDPQSFIDVYKRYLEHVPNASWAAANLGSALLFAKDYKSAVRWLARAKQLGNRNKYLAVDLAQAKKMAKSRPVGR